MLLSQTVLYLSFVNTTFSQPPLFNIACVIDITKNIHVHSTSPGVVVKKTTKKKKSHEMHYFKELLNPDIFCLLYYAT